MGHSRLGYLPQTYRWTEVIALIAGDATAADIAKATMIAARAGLMAALTDPGIRDVVEMLAKVAIASRGDDFAMALHDAGVSVAGQPSMFELVAAVTSAVDDQWARQGKTDFAEMALMSAAEAMTSSIGTRLPTMFSPTSADVHEAVYELSKENGFGALTHEFFARHLNRFLNYHLSRELSCHVGAGRRFANIYEHEQFKDRLMHTCREAALVVRDYSKAWYSKSRFEDGCSRKQVGRFVETSLKKLRAELERRHPSDQGKGGGRAA